MAFRFTPRPDQYTPAQKSDGSGIGQILGGVIGAGLGFLSPVPGGTIVGAQFGQSIGGTIGGSLSPDTPAQKIEKQPYAPQTSTAMQRALEAQQPKEDHLQTLVDAAYALPDAPAHIQEQYTEPIVTALHQQMKLRQQGQA